MGKNKTISKETIIKHFMDYALEHNENPKTVYAFTKIYGFEEADFYKYFATFETIESSIFETFFINSIEALNNNEDYQNFDARNKLLSFYYTFFENLTANRSYVKSVLEQHENQLKSLKTLSDLKILFTNYVGNLGIQLLDLKHNQLEKIQDKSLKETAWLQLLMTMKFWLDDSSASFEKTDIFIEKSVNTTFDILNVATLSSVLDLGKFLFKEKFQMN